MAPAKYETTSVKVAGGDYTFTVSASKVAFEGFLSVYMQEEDMKKGNVCAVSYTHLDVYKRQVSNRVAVRYNPRRALVGDTDNGKALKERIQELKQLLDAYRKGVIKDVYKRQVDSFAKKIDIENTNQILQYGAGTQKKMADFSDAALENVRTQDLGEVGELITQVVGELRDFDAAEEEKGFLGFFKKQGSKIENMKNRYAKARCV